jgi:hypothetical protein
LLAYRESFGQATTAPAAKNFVVVTWPEGLEPGWLPTGTENDFQLSDMLTPFAPHQKDLVIVSGLKGGTNNIILAHSEGTMSLWTGALPGGLAESLASRASLDQAIAAKIGGDTPYRSLHFGTQTNRISFISNPYVHYAGQKQPVPAEDDPTAMYQLIFGAADQDQAALDRLRLERRSVLDSVRGDLAELRTKIAVSDREKLDKHGEGIRGIERALDSLGNTCATPASAPTLTKEAAMLDENFPAVIKLQTDLLVSALECGMTRVATLQLSNTDSQTHIPGLATTRTVHEAQHNGTAADRNEIAAFFVKQLAYVIERLKSVTYPDGRTLLDDTLVVMGSEMAMGSHWNDPMPFFIAGGGGAGLRLGRYLQVPGVPRHTKLLTSVAQLMGLSDVQTFGDFSEDDATGPLPGLVV